MARRTPSISRTRIGFRRTSNTPREDSVHEHEIRGQRGEDGRRVVGLVDQGHALTGQTEPLQRVRDPFPERRRIVGDQQLVDQRRWRGAEL
jgi:hypothetical protein